jgi:hypothetical protein
MIDVDQVNGLKIRIDRRKVENVIGIVIFNLIIFLVTLTPIFMIPYVVLVNIFLSIFIPFDIFILSISISLIKTYSLVREILNEPANSRIRIIDNFFGIKKEKVYNYNDINIIHLSSNIVGFASNPFFISIILNDGKPKVLIPYLKNQKPYLIKRLHNLLKTAIPLKNPDEIYLVDGLFKIISDTERGFIIEYDDSDRANSLIPLVIVGTTYVILSVFIAYMGWILNSRIAFWIVFLTLTGCLSPILFLYTIRLIKRRGRMTRLEVDKEKEEIIINKHEKEKKMTIINIKSNDLDALEIEEKLIWIKYVQKHFLLKIVRINAIDVEIFETSIKADIETIRLKILNLLGKTIDFYL